MKFIWEADKLDQFLGVEIVFRNLTKEGILHPSPKKTSILGYMNNASSYLKSFGLTREECPERVYIIMDVRWGESYIYGSAEETAARLNKDNYVPLQFLTPKRFFSQEEE